MEVWFQWILSPVFFNCSCVSKVTQILKHPLQKKKRKKKNTVSTSWIKFGKLGKSCRSELMVSIGWLTAFTDCVSLPTSSLILTKGCRAPRPLNNSQRSAAQLQEPIISTTFILHSLLVLAGEHLSAAAAANSHGVSAAFSAVDNSMFPKLAHRVSWIRLLISFLGQQRYFSCVRLCLQLCN